MTNHDDESSSWSLLDVAALMGAFTLRWQVGIAFLVLKIWHQASGSQLSTFPFIVDRWNAFVDIVRSAGRGAGSIKTKVESTNSNRSLSLPAPTGNLAFDDWQNRERERLLAEQEKLEQEKANFERYQAESRRDQDRIVFDAYMANKNRLSEHHPDA